MNRLRLPGTVWLASDMHLGPQGPETRRAFLSFLSQAAHQADALVLGGDIFNVWVGDDIIESAPPWLAELLQALANTALTTRLLVCRGNRDFLIGPALCAHIGATLLDEQTVLQTDAGDILFSHGDEYCTDDHRYQRFKQWVRKPWLQTLFKSFSLTQRQRWAGYARARSMQENRHKRGEIMDVNEAAVKAAFAAAGVTTMVHGHTHRSAKHSLHNAAGNTLTRIVLPDWDFDSDPAHGGWLEATAGGGLALKAFNSAS